MAHRFGWLLVAAIVGLVPSNAGATTVLFEDVCSSDECAILAPYGGLTWSNFYVIDATSTVPQDNGYFRGRVSGDFVAFNGGADPAEFLNGTPFDFVSTYLTAAWRTGLNVTVQGFVGTNLLYTQTVVVDDQAPTLFNFDYRGVDSVRFMSFGGVESSGTGFQFAMDNLTLDNLVYSPVPEPSTLLLLAGGLLAGARRAGAAWRRYVA